jgi:hypothetical protein
MAASEAYPLALLPRCDPAGCTPDSTATPAPTARRTALPAHATTAPPAFPVTLTDDEGTKVTIPALPARIVSLTPDITETLFAIGAGDRVVGKVEDLAKFPPEAANVPVVATFAGVDVERIVAPRRTSWSAGDGLTQRRRRAAAPRRHPGARQLPDHHRRWASRALPDRAGGGPRGEGATISRTRSSPARPARGLAATAPTKPRVFYDRRHGGPSRRRPN